MIAPDEESWNGPCEDQTFESTFRATCRPESRQRHKDNFRTVEH